MTMLSRIPRTIDTDGLLSRWLLDGNANDSVGGRHGTWTGNAKYIRDPRLGGQIAAEFDGSGYITFSPAGLPSGASVWTVAGWARWRATDAGAMLSYGTNSNGQYAAIQHSSSAIRVARGGGDVESGINALSSGAWHHCAAVYNGATLSLLVNGVLQASGAHTLNMGLTAGNIGGVFAGTLMVGSICDCRIYNTAKSAAQILAMARLEA